MFLKKHILTFLLYVDKITYSVLRAQILEKYQAYEKHIYDKKRLSQGVRVGRVAEWRPKGHFPSNIFSIKLIA